MGTVAALSRPPTRLTAPEHLPPLLPRKELLLLLGTAYRSLLADYYWLQTTAATGAARTDKEYRDIYFLADLITDLDPDFEYVYHFAGVIIPYNHGRERWVNTLESTRILEKGIARFPTSVPLRVLHAYNLSSFHLQYERAAALLAETARLPGAPRYLGELATRLYAQAGRMEAGMMLAASLAEEAMDGRQRQVFERRVLHLQLEQELRRVDEASKAFRSRTGQPATTLAELLVSGDLQQFPVDPFGGAIIIGPNGTSLSTAERERMKVYLPPGMRAQ
jgi:hypothetical protein